MKAVRLALLKLSREWRAGEYWVLIMALVVAVSALTAVSFFTSRIDRGMNQRANEVLAADIRLQSSQPLSNDYLQQAHALGIHSAQVETFNSVVVLDDLSSLTTLYAVSTGYPLRGKLKISDGLTSSSYQTNSLPESGEVWVDPRLLSRLNASIGSELQIGKRKFKVAKVLQYRPDQGTQFVELAPTLLMRIEDIESTSLVGLGSRVQHRLLFAGDSQQCANLAKWLKAHEQVGVRLQQLGDASPQLQKSIERAGRFLNLTAVITVLLAGVSVAMAARRYVSRQLDTVALMKSMGATQSLVLSICSIELFLLGCVAGIVGTALGYVAQSGLAYLAKDLMKETLPEPALQVALLGLITPFLILVGFALPSLLQLKRTPPIRILRRDVRPASMHYLGVYVIAVAALLILLTVLIADTKLVAYVSMGTLATLIVLGVAGYFLVYSLKWIRGSVGVSWRYGVANISRRGSDSIIQLVAFGLALMVLLLLVVVKNDLLREWDAGLPNNTPNQFLINISPEQAVPVQQFFVERNIAKPVLVPMLRARMVSINGIPVSDRKINGDMGRSFIEREANLTWSRELQDGNQIIAGKWWDENDPANPKVSVEARIARELDLKLGDVIRYDVAGEIVDATVSSIREVRWDTFRPNFFMVFSPGVLDKMLGTYITSVHLDSEHRDVMTHFYREFPEVTAIDIDAVINQVRGVIDNATLAIQYEFYFSLLAGVTLLIATIMSTRDERRYESAMLRTLGASRYVVLRSLAAEFSVLGFLAGVLGAGAASVVGYVLATRVFNIPYHVDVNLWIIGSLSGLLIVGITGVAFTRSVINAPPAAVLRER